MLRNTPAVIVLIVGGPRWEAGKVVGGLAEAGGSRRMASALLVVLLLVVLLVVLLLLGASRGIKAKKRHGSDLGSSRVVSGKLSLQQDEVGVRVMYVAVEVVGGLNGARGGGG